MTVLYFVSAVNSALLNSTVKRRGSRSSLSETGMTALAFIRAVNSAFLNSTVRRRGSRSSLSETGMTVLSFVSAVNSALLHSTVRRRGSRSSLNETGMTVISFISVILVAPKRKKPTHLSGLLFFIGSPVAGAGRCSTLTWGRRTVSSKQTVLLAPFGAASPLAKTGGPLRERTTAK